MRKIKFGSHGAALGAILAMLAATGCNDADTAGQNVVEPGNASVAEEIEEPADTSDAESSEMAVLPEPSAQLGETEAAMLAEAAAIDEAIASGDAAIEEAEVNGGSVWMEDGQIVRIAASGQRVSYFRRDEEAPFVVQRGRRVYLVENGEATGGVNQRGRSIELTEQRREQAAKLIRRAITMRSRQGGRSRRNGRDEATR